MRPTREVATNNGQTYFVTSNTVDRKCFFRSEAWADLFVETLYEYRPERLAIHGFVVMEDHFHLLMTPMESLERAVQCIKGGFSYRVKKYLGRTGDVWVVGFSDHRIRDEEDFAVHQRYIAKNAIESRGIERAQDHPYCSAGGRFQLDVFPQGLKPGFVEGRNGAAEAAPFQNNNEIERPPFVGVLQGRASKEGE
jgi:putative transposase